MLLLALAHLHVLPDLDQAVMAKCTCLLLRDRHCSGRICSKNEPERRLEETVASLVQLHTQLS